MQHVRGGQLCDASMKHTKKLRKIWPPPSSWRWHGRGLHTGENIKTGLWVFGLFPIYLPKCVFLSHEIQTNVLFYGHPPLLNSYKYFFLSSLVLRLRQRANGHEWPCRGRGQCYFTAKVDAVVRMSSSFKQPHKLPRHENPETLWTCPHSIQIQ